MTNRQDEIIWVKRSPTDWESAKYPFEALENPCWGDYAGGLQVPLPYPFIQGYVWCNGMVEGEVAHSGSHGPCPHRIKVCVIKRYNDPKVYDKLISIVGPGPSRYSSKRKHWCITDIKDILKRSNKPVPRKDLLEELGKRGHSGSAMVGAIKTHKDVFNISKYPENKRSFQYDWR